MNNNNNSCNHEILFWKVFRNIYIRNFILSKIINNNNNQINYSYNGTTSLKLMINNNKLQIILDKLKSNHYIQLDCIPDWNKQSKEFKIKDPYYKSIITEITQLLLLKHIYIKRSMYENMWYKKCENSMLEYFKLCYPDNKNNYNNYMAHHLLYKLLLSDHHDNNKLIKILNQQINNNDNNNNNKEYIKTIKKQKINNSDNDKREYFIQQLISTSSSSLTLSTIENEIIEATLENEIIEAIYNDQPIPIHINQYYSNLDHIKIYNNYNQDLYENQLKVDMCSILLNLNLNTVITSCSNKKVLELILLKLLYHHQDIIELELSYRNIISKYPINSIIHAKIYCLNEMNSWNNKENTFSSILKFKQHLINNQVSTLDELISAARDIFNELDYEKCFGHYYSYHLITSNQLDKYSFNSDEHISLLLDYSIITQQTELFDRYFKLSTKSGSFYKYLPVRNSVGFNNNNNQLIKDKSTTYFNHIIKEINSFYQKENLIDYHNCWFSIFKMIIMNYNSKLFEWLLESNKELRDIYHTLLLDYFPKLFLVHTRIDKYTDQVDYDMLDVLINQFKTIKIPIDFEEYSDIGIDKFIINSNQRKVKIFNHLIKSVSNFNIIHDIVEVLFQSFKELDNVDDIIKIYSQIDQQLLLNYYSSINENQYQYWNMLVISTYQNKSSILVPVLIQSIINLDFNSIYKITSATLNNNNNSNTNISDNNIYIPTTFNNSLDIIRYLITKQYLKEFSLYYILDEIITYIQVDKGFIMELIGLSNNSDTTVIDELIKEFEKRYEDMDQIRNDQHIIKNNQLKNQLFSLSTLVRIKYEYQNTKDFTFLNGTELESLVENERNQEYQTISYAIFLYYIHGYYNPIYHFLSNNDLDLDFKSLKFYTHGISIDWFSKLYPILFKNILNSKYEIITYICYHNPPEIFEFIWHNHFNNNDERVKYIIDLLTTIFYIPDFQFLEYVLKTKREFIITFVELNQDQLFNVYQNFLIRHQSIQVFHQLRLTFPSFNFKINHDILKRLNIYKGYEGNRYETMEYLFENNLISNLEQIIGTDNLNSYRIIEYNKLEIRKKDITYISKPMFILIHTIIKLQKQQQQHQQQHQQQN